MLARFMGGNHRISERPGSVLVARRSTRPGYAPAMKPVITRPGEGRRIPYGGQEIRVLCDVGAFAVAEFTVPAGFGGPQPHIHHDVDEGFHVLEGTLQVVVGEDTVQAPPGTFMLATRGNRHAFSNPSDQPVRVLGYWSPARGLALVEALGKLITAAGVPDASAVEEIYREHNSELA
jgi:mannose-6-phosphate isomerase-like protein (cupin superfamily)